MNIKNSTKQFIEKSSEPITLTIGFQWFFIIAQKFKKMFIPA